MLFYLNKQWIVGEVFGTRYGLGSTGWVDTNLFKRWLTDHLLIHAVGGSPILLALDGYSTHYQPELIKYAIKNKVILFYLPPHTTHESQPLDASVFKPLKQNWNAACNRFMQQNPGKVVTRYNFSPLLNEAWSKTMVPNVISAGFKRAGIYPFNSDIIHYGVPANSEERNSQPPDSVSRQQPPLETVIYQQWLRINHPTTEQVQENETNEVAGNSTSEMVEFSLEQQQEEFDDHAGSYQVDQQWLDTDSLSQDLLQEDCVADFSPEQEL